MEQKLSVALCTYNGMAYIEQQLDSILNQELPVDEVVVSDDGSSDDTMNIVRRIASEYQQIHWIFLQNASQLGVIRNFEQAICQCTGDIVFLSDQDDVWRRDKTQVIVSYFNSHPEKDVVFSDAELVDDKGNKLSDRSLLDAWQLLPNIDFWESGFCLESMMFCNRATGATMAFRRCCSESFLPFDNDLLYLHDYQIAMYACIKGSLGLVKASLIQYRQHGKNVMGVPKDNWVYTEKDSEISLLKEGIEPVPVRPVCKKYHSSRLEFYRKRVDNYCTIKGKIKLFSLLPQYIRFYKAYWNLFFVSDFLYGINDRLRKAYIKHFIHS